MVSFERVGLDCDMSDSKKEKKSKKKEEKKRAREGADQVHARQWTLEEEKQMEQNETFVWGAKREVSVSDFSFSFFFFFLKLFQKRNSSSKE